MTRDRTFTQWVTFLRDPPDDQDSEWVLLEDRIKAGPPEEQWAILRAFVSHSLPPSSMTHLGERVVQPLIDSEHPGVVRELQASIAEAHMSQMLDAVNSPRARELIEDAAASSK